MPIITTKKKIISYFVLVLIFMLFSSCVESSRVIKPDSQIRRVENGKEILKLEDSKVPSDVSPPPVPPQQPIEDEKNHKDLGEPKASMSQTPISEVQDIVAEKGREISGEGMPEEKQNQSRFENAKRDINTPVKRFHKDRKKDGSVTFNFDNADLYEVIRTFAEILSINYIVDPNVRGRVTIHTSGELDRSDLFPLFFQILEANGLTAVQENGLYKILKTNDASKNLLFARYGRDMAQIPVNERMVMQIVPLKYISPREIVATLTPFLSETGTILPQEGSDILILLEKNSNIKRVLQLIDLFDVDLFNNIEHRFFRLKNIESSEAERVLNNLVQPYLAVKKSRVDIINIDRINTLIVICKDPRILEKMGEFITKIDVEENSEEPRIFIYKIKNSEADELALILTKVFSENEPEENLPQEKTKEALEKDNKKAEPPPLFVNNTPKKQKKDIQDRSGYGSSDLKGKVKITPDKDRDILIIEASPNDYKTIKKILTELDILPKQVLINVLVVDVTLTKNMQLGVEWSFLKDRAGETGLLSASAGEAGISFTTGVTREWTAALKALAVNDKTNVLSAPSVLASDNLSATINVGNQIPITTSSYDTDNGVTTTTVQYRDTGISLTVTPHINEYGMVTMELQQQVSDQADGSSTDSHPTFFNRSVDTTLTVKDGQTIVIGGLISESVTDGERGVPGLVNIPILGALFGNKKDNKTKNELVIFITPRVIETVNDIDYISREFLQESEGIRRTQKVINLFPDE